MPRNDDFGDLPSLMPDSDEIKATTKHPKAVPSASQGAAVAAASPRQPTRHVAASRAAQPSNTPQVVGKTSGTLWTLVLLMLVTVVGGGFWAYNKLTDVDLLLTVSRGELDHARKRIGELEALVVATDVNSNKSGTVVQTQVKLIDDRAKERNKFLDTEIDKLWGVAYRTNRPAIEENQKATDNNTATVKQHKEQIQSQGQLFEQQQTALQAQQTQVDKVTNASQLAVQQVEDQLHKLVLLQDKLAQVLTTVTTHEKALSDQNKTSLGHAQLAQQQAQDVAALETTIQQQQQTLADLESTVQQQEQALVEMTVLLESAGSADQADALSSRVNRLESNARLVTALEQNASQMDERVFMVEQSLDSVDSFRRDTNRSLDQVRAQIRNLAYGE
ncbi:MAG TPA: hypothetical protein DE045_06050 [Oceanospirillaceae bacterium]|nr:hypothetical protein [Oceanospirillaceae bacterium]